MMTILIVLIIIVEQVFDTLLQLPAGAAWTLSLSLSFALSLALSRALSWALSCSLLSSLSHVLSLSLSLSLRELSTFLHLALPVYSHSIDPLPNAWYCRSVGREDEGLRSHESIPQSRWL